MGPYGVAVMRSWRRAHERLIGDILADNGHVRATTTKTYNDAYIPAMQIRS